MLKSIDRLEQALRLWEDHCFLQHKIVQLVTLCPGQVDISGPAGVGCKERRQLNVGAFANFRSFRKYLLNSIHSHAPFDFERYIGCKQVQDLLGCLAWLPLSLWSWTRESRRVYHLSNELQLLLNMTSLNGVTWGEVELPFDSFAISLQDPLVDESSGDVFDLITVSKVAISNIATGQSWTNLEFTLFPSRLEQSNHLQLKERDKVEEMVRKREWQALAQWIGRFHRRFGGHGVLGLSFSYSKNKDALIMDENWGASSDIPAGCEPLYGKNPVPLMTKVFRLVAGLALYFKSLPPNHSYVRDESSRERKERISSYDKTCIAKEAHVCVVSSCFKLTREECEVLASCRSGAGGYEMRAHFRCGYWRRPPGLGSNPTAEKNVWVRPALVRRDRLAPGSVPGGAEHQL